MSLRNLKNERGFLSDYFLFTVLAGKRKASEKQVDTARWKLRRLLERVGGRDLDAATCRERFVRPLLQEALGHFVGAGSERIHALHASADAEAAGGKPHALVWCGASDEDLGHGGSDGQGMARLERALAEANVRYGLLVTAERLRLIRAPGFGPPRAYLELDLPGAAEGGDTASLGVALRIFGREAFEPGPDGRSPLDLLEEQSRHHAARVSEDLRGAVHSASESLIAGLIADAVARGELADPAAMDEARLRLVRDAALTALYRLLFILYAEARDERLQAHRIYHENYSVHTLVTELTRDPTRRWPENRCSIWSRLLALFRIYDSGMPAHGEWERIPPRGGNLFAQDTPEGRVLAAARLPDRVIAEVVVDLATTAARPGVGRERVFFRELDIEQLGSVYEGLLDFEPRVAREPALELKVQGRTFVLPPEEIVRLCEAKDLKLAGDVALVEGTVAEALHPDAVAEEDQDDDSEDDEDGDDDSAGEEDEGGGLKKGGVARLVRRIAPGTFHFVPGGARKGSGSFYTPLPLVRDVVRHALGLLVEGRTAAEIEQLRVLDPACGSGHFLIEAMRFLGQGLHRAYVREHGSAGPPAYRGTKPWDADCDAKDELARAANSEARAWCKRRVAERCLFGVDLNPTAVNLAHVALWVESLAGDRPLTYFEHHVRCGNSLLGTWLDRFRLPPLPDLRGGVRGDVSMSLFEARPIQDLIREAAAERRLIDEASQDDLRREGITPDTVDELRFKEARRRAAEQTLSAARLVFDLRSAAVFVPEIWREFLELAARLDDLPGLEHEVAKARWFGRFAEVRSRERFFHWELEFPEVFLDERRRGFDAVIGNPPWDKVLPTKHEFYAGKDVLIRAFKGNELDARIRELHGRHAGLAEAFAAYRERTTSAAQFLRKGGDFPLSEARSAAAHEDLSKYFVDRAARLAGRKGAVGLIVPSAIYNGDGAVGIRRHLLSAARVERFYAFENRGDKTRGIPKPFPIDSRYKFVSLVFRAGEPADGFDAAFMRRDLSELEDAGEKPWLVRITREEVERLSPETLAFLEYRGPRDQEIVRRMHAGRPTLGGEGLGSWGVTLFTDLAHVQIYNGARDKDLFTDPRTHRLHTPESVLGRVPADLSELLRAMAARGFLPVYEGKSVDQYLVGTKPVRWWLSVEQAKAKYGKEPRREATVVFRETASNTNERTCIAAVLPPGSAGSHTLTGLLATRVEPDAAVAVLDSFCFDWLLRLRAAGTHVSFTYILPLAVPPADVADRLPRIPTRLAWEAGLGHVTEDRGTWPLLWQANRAVAEAYGLAAEDFLHVLGTFPGVAKKRREFFAWLLEQTEAWRAEQAEARERAALRVADPSEARAEPSARPAGRAGGRGAT